MVRARKGRILVYERNKKSVLYRAREREAYGRGVSGHSYQEAIDEIIDDYKDHCVFTTKRIFLFFQNSYASRYPKVNENTFKPVAVKCLREKGAFRMQKKIKGKKYKVWTMKQENNQIIPTENANNIGNLRKIY